MAVARINHDLRNMLSAAQLISDRLATIADPQAQRLAPKLVATLDRAIQFCQTTLTYGAGSEQPPERRRFDLNRMVQDVVDAACAEARRGCRLPCRHSSPLRDLRRSGPDSSRAREPEPQRRAGADVERRRRPAAEGDPVRRDSHRRHGSDRDQRHGPGLPIGSEGANLRAVPEVDQRGGDRARPVDRRRPRDAQRRPIDLAPAKADDFYCGARFLIKLPTPERAVLMSLRPLPHA